MFGQFQLRAGQNRQRVEHVKNGFCLGHGRLADEFQYHPLGGLPAERYANQLSHADGPFHFRWQAIVKNSCDRRNIDSNS